MMTSIMISEVKSGNTTHLKNFFNVKMHISMATVVEFHRELCVIQSSFRPDETVTSILKTPIWKYGILK